MERGGIESHGSGLQISSHNQGQIDVRHQESGNKEVSQTIDSQKHQFSEEIRVPNIDSHLEGETTASHLGFQETRNRDGQNHPNN